MEPKEEILAKTRTTSPQISMNAAPLFLAQKQTPQAAPLPKLPVAHAAPPMKPSAESPMKSPKPPTTSTELPTPQQTALAVTAAAAAATARSASTMIPAEEILAKTTKKPPSPKLQQRPRTKTGIKQAMANKRNREETTLANELLKNEIPDERRKYDIRDRRNRRCDKIKTMCTNLEDGGKCDKNFSLSLKCKNCWNKC